MFASLRNRFPAGIPGFDRLRIRAKLGLVVALPLLAVAALTVPIVTGALERAQRAEELRADAALANQVAGLAGEIRQERLLSVGFVVEASALSRLISQRARVDEQVAALTEQAGSTDGGVPAAVAAAVPDTADLAGLREAVVERALPAEQVVAAYSEINTALVDSLDLMDRLDLTAPGARQLAALDAALRLSEAAGQGTDALLIIAGTGSEAAAIQYLSNLRILAEYTERFNRYATPAQLEQLEIMSEAFVAQPETGEGVAFTEDPWEAVGDRTANSMFRPLESLSHLGQYVEAQVVADALADVDAQQQAALRTAYLVGFGATLLVLLVIAVTVLLARAVVRPLLNLTGSAHRVAQVAEAELARVADDEHESDEPIRMEPIPTTGSDEIGDLARAFDRVQTTAVQLVERQVASRRNVGLMFGYLGRRTENLVSRQISLIDQLENNETDPARLADLYRLDHISSRLRRNAGSLAALSGTVGADEYVAPLPLANAVRLALGEIEDYRRVDVQVPANLQVVPALGGDLVLLLAELMENATTFSPPHTRVTVTAVSGEAGATVTIIDHGIGMEPDRLAEENSRLSRRERLDLAPTEVLGLFVVGRLSRRHGLRVRLLETAGGGVTAVVEIARTLLAEATSPPRSVGTASPTSPAAPAHPAAPVSAGAETSPAAPLPAAPESAEADPRSQPAPTLVDVAALSKANQALAAAQRWNAFAVATTAPTAPTDSDESAPQPSARTATGTAAVPPPAATPGGAHPNGAAPRPASAPPATPGEPEAPGSPEAPAEPTDANGRPTTLRRRVPGATLTDTGPIPRRTPHRAGPVQGAAPEEARALIEQLQDGVARAHSEIRSHSGTEETQHDR
ncbi:sensor histidine kinase [Natronosporangium hydrolyticum]|uniref:histidine kinase n=1 Tax=Natronosporangium hydrolyticum TaxID=2811111 RepID=A0A895YGP6_9ACTN|nr:nitrate- and nitrite sensing domain-containing protein [Natronosporangium hydrolyticum]QSB13350.1 sensor histidine kinase [Natronosporangium hydrolyticum]